MTERDGVPEQELTLLDSAFRPGGQSAAVQLCEHNQRTYVYKKFNDRTLAAINVPALWEMRAWRDSLNDLTREQLDNYTTWPVEIVTGSSGAVGVLMRPIPDSYLTANANGDKVPRHLTELMRKRTDTASDGRPWYPPPEKLEVLGAYLQSMQWLHRQGLVIGDVQERNAVFARNASTSARDRVRIMFLDCDSFEHPAWGAVHPRSAPFTYQIPTVVRAIGEDGAFSHGTDYTRFVCMALFALAETASREPSKIIENSRGELLQCLPSDIVDRMSRYVTAVSLPAPDIERWAADAQEWIWYGPRMWVRTDASTSSVWELPALTATGPELPDPTPGSGATVTLARRSRKKPVLIGAGALLVVAAIIAVLLLVL